MGGNPLPLYAWVAWELHLAGCLDKRAGWEEFVGEVSGLVEGKSVWPSPIWEKIAGFETEVGWRLRALRPQDWKRWKGLMERRALKALASGWGYPCGVHGRR